VNQTMTILPEWQPSAVLTYGEPNERSKNQPE
ncbi:MAG: hypothetical protein ACJAXU_000468, partial [Paracoccaceae bacterium]